MPSKSDDPLVRAWASSGVLALTGPRGDDPLMPPRGVLQRIAALGAPLAVDPFALLSERAAIAGLRRQGRVSCGGGTRLLEAADGWVAVALPRVDDRESVPAWLGIGDPGPDPWPAVACAVASRPVAALLESAHLLGLAVTAVGERAGDGAPPVTAKRIGDRPPTAEPLVVDLSSLWAGPLCARLLRERDARVVKVESTGRPDGARAGPTAFFDLLHAGSRSVALDFTDAADRRRLAALVARADVVIEASRPRALRQLGIIADEVVRAGPAVWVSLTAHGRTRFGGERVGFGDDIAAAGGLVALDAAGEPCFAADAIADPLSGVTAANAASEALGGGGRWLLDVDMGAVAAHVGGGSAPAPWDRWPGDVPEPPVREPVGRGPRLGEHGGQVLAELGIA